MDINYKTKVDQQKLQEIIDSLNRIGYEYIEGFVSNKKDKVRAIHRECGKERFTKFCLYDQKECKYCKRQTADGKNQKCMSHKDKELIKQLYNEGKNYVEIAKNIGFTPNAVGKFLRDNGFKKQLKIKTTKTATCKVCNKVFVPKYRHRDKACSQECVSQLIRISKIKYSEFDIERVKDYKKKKFTNEEIVQLTSVDLNKVKEIVRSNNLTLTKKEMGQNAYRAKLAKNPKCMEDMRESREFKYTIENLNDHASKKNGKCLNKKYTGYNTEYSWKCEKGHVFKKEWGSVFSAKTWCPYCTSQHSKAEQEILDWVKQWYPNSHSTRQIIKPKEIDIYIPELKIGIEYCGLYWHNEKSPQPRDRNYHKNKMLQCQEQGIRLLTIFEDEWTNRQKQVKNFIKSVMGIHSKRVYARKCEIKEVESAVAHRFLDDNHIQGKTSIKIAFGLFYENELLGLVTGNKHHRNFEGKNEFVLNRLVFGDEVQVVGGASKLIQHLCKYAKEQGFNRLISWSDNRYSEGNVYEKCGFIIEDTVPPDYSYVTPDLRRESKQSNKKALLLKKGAVGNMSMTETQLADTLGYARIWDCGKKKFVINL